MFSSVAPSSSIHDTEFPSPETSIFAVNHRRRQHMKLLFLPLTLPHPNPLLQSTKISCLYQSRKPYSSRIRTPIPPRDTVIDFGKHKGKMLGSLPSAYLKWVKKNLITAEFEKWAKLADQVLADPIYKDRIEWEFADRLMTGNSFGFNYSGEGVAEELKQLSERFGWDFGHDAGWGKINFELLGTSFGGRIPRIDPNRPRGGVEREAQAKREKAKAAATMDGEASARERRRERMRSKRSERSSEGRSKVARQVSFNGLNESDDEEGDQKRTAEVVPKRSGRSSEGRSKVARQVSFDGLNESDDEEGDQKRTAEVVPKRSGRSSEGRSKVARQVSFDGLNESDDEEGDQKRTAEVVPKRFPGRESLWKKVIDRERRL